MGRHPWFGAFLSLAVSAVAPRLALADGEPVGPAIGNNSFAGSVTPAGDTDDFVGALLPGETVTVTVTAAKAGKLPPTLRPSVVFVDPDGAERSDGATTSGNGLSVTYRAFVIDKPGVWSVRVSGKDGSSGPYTAKFAVRAPRKQTLTGQSLGGGMPSARGYPFAGVEGASFSAAATWRRGQTPVEFVGIHRPDGAEVLRPDGSEARLAARTKGTKTQVARIVLDGGSGQYELRTFIPSGASAFTLTIDVRPPKRPVSKKVVKLTDTEPVLDVLAVPKAGEPGDTVRFTGTGFAAGKLKPVVRFGRADATGVVVSADGTTIDCVVPPRAGPAFVTVTVTNPDGQATARADYFAYQPPPVVEDLVDALAGAEVRTSPTTGGRTVRLLGDNFEDGYRVDVGGVAVPQVTRVSESELRFVLPPAPQGMHLVRVTDPFLREAFSPFEVRYKTPPSFDAAPFSPPVVKLATPTTVTISGSDFLGTDRLLVDGAEIAATFESDTTISVNLPGLTGGTHSFQLLDEIGTLVTGPGLLSKGPGVVTSVSVSSGPVIAGNEIPFDGGSEIRVDGTSFSPSDTVTLGGVDIDTFPVSTSTRKTFTAPGGLQGPAQLVITDGAGQTTTVDDALIYAGLTDDTADRHPATDGTDDFRAVRGAVADLDADGDADDVVLVSPIGSSPGERTVRTRVLFGDDDGVLADGTDGAIPAAQSDPSGIETWDAHCLAVGDVDSDGVADIVIGGVVLEGTESSYYRQVRLLRNDGSGAFTHEVYYGPGVRYEGPTYAYYPSVGYYYTYGYTQTGKPLFEAVQQQGLPTAVAIGDIDGDEDMDVIVGTDHFESRQVNYDPAKAVYQYISGYYYGRNVWVVNLADSVNYRQYVPALRIYENLGFQTEGGGLRDASADRLPGAGTSAATTSQPAALHARDLALGLLNGDSLPDLVVAWDDPSTVTAYGMSSAEANGQSSATASIATRILLNDGEGGFTSDATSTWMPTPSDPDWWQADRVALADLDGDSDLDLVLLLSESVDAWTGTPTRSRRALRVLQNTGGRFSDATSGLPALAANDQDDFRGDALSVRDVNGDGHADILVSTGSAIVNLQGTTLPSVRVFFGEGSLRWTLGRPYLPGTATDTGEASDLLWSDDLDADGRPVLIYVNERAPAVSPSSRRLRTEVWTR